MGKEQPRKKEAIEERRRQPQKQGRTVARQTVRRKARGHTYIEIWILVARRFSRILPIVPEEPEAYSLLEGGGALESVQAQPHYRSL